MLGADGAVVVYGATWKEVRDASKPEGVASEGSPEMGLMMLAERSRELTTYLLRASEAPPRACRSPDALDLDGVAVAPRQSTPPDVRSAQ